MRLLELEWDYLSDDCKSLAVYYMSMGITDLEMAMEMAIASLGDERAFDLGAKDEKGRD